MRDRDTGFTTQENFDEWAKELAQIYPENPDIASTYTEVVSELLEEGYLHIVGVPPDTEEAGYIYVIQSGDHYKIGRTNDLDRRMGELKLQPPQPPRTIMAIAVGNAPAAEKSLHQYFAPRRTNGEWFQLTPEELATIEQLVQPYT